MALLVHSHAVTLFLVLDVEEPRALNPTRTWHSSLGAQLHWAEAGQNFGVFNDDNPYHADCSPDTVQTTDQPLGAFLTKARRTWRSYQEDIDVDTTNLPLPMSAWTVPMFSVSGLFATTGLNAYNYTTQYDYASKHNPMVFFTDTNGGCNTTTSNPLRTHYAPLQQLALDLQHDRVADYNWITPDPYNDMHTALSTGYGKYPTTDDGGQFPGEDRAFDRCTS